MSQQEHHQEPDKSHCKLYVSNLDFAFSNKKIEGDLHGLFESFGHTLSITVRRNQKMKKVYAFVLYNTPQQAREALENLDGEYVGDTKLKVEFQRGPKQARVIDNKRLNSLTCYRCGKAGHFARFCTEKPAFTSRNDNRQHRRETKRNRSRQKRKRSESSSSSSSSSGYKRKHRRRSRSLSSNSSSSS